MEEHTITKCPTRTNFCSLRGLLAIYTPEKKSLITDAEKKLIEDQLEINCRDVMNLQNLRDFVVLYLSTRNEVDELVNLDRMSAIAAVIDEQIVKRGGEV